MQMQQQKAAQERAAKMRQAYGQPGGQVLAGPPNPGQTQAPQTLPTGMYNPQQQQQAMMQMARHSENPLAAIQRQQQIAAQKKQQTWGMSPQWVRDKVTGQTLPVQFSNTGQAMIPGVGPADPRKYEFLRPVNFQDMGGQVVPFGFGSTDPAGVYQKTLKPGEQPVVKGAQAEATAAGTVAGRTGAEAARDLPSIRATAEQTMASIDEIINHPGLEYAVGASSVLPIIPGTPAADFTTRLEQLQGGVFLQAYQDLKGGGQITEVEGKKAEQAKARMATAQTEKEFIRAMKDYKSAIKTGLMKAQNAAKNPRRNASPQANQRQEFDGWSIKEKK